MPRSRKISIVRWLVMCARGVFAVQRYLVTRILSTPRSTAQRRPGPGGPAADDQHVRLEESLEVHEQSLSLSTDVELHRTPGGVEHTAVRRGAGPVLVNSTTRLSLTPNTASRSRYSSPATKMWVTSVR